MQPSLEEDDVAMERAWVERVIAERDDPFTVIAKRLADLDARLYEYEKAHES